MNWFSKQPTETHEQLVNRAMQSITQQNTTLMARKDSALSQFRQTADELRLINEGLSATAQVATEMVNFFSTYKQSTEKAIADNGAVRDRILAIIGE